MRPVRAAALLPAVLVAAVAVAGCGGGGSTDRPATTANRAAPAPQGGRGLDPNILPPRSVPRRPVDAPNPAAVRVIEAWSRDVRRGDFRAAARLFALPARFQNGTPVLTLRRRIDVLAVISGFTCGAVPTRFGAASGYTLVRFRLTTRVGGDCQGAEGHTTGGAIRVVGGRIRAWYRLFDPEEIAPHAPRADPNGPEV